MKIDIVSIFPDYLAPLGLSLAGRARATGLLDLRVHDLRDWTHDRHRTVDDTPAGGGAGMVMKPEPWGEALDDLLSEGATLVVPTPAGVRFDQAAAAELATHDHLVFACGRYEGIDQRVADHYAADHDVREVSIGDYVLNGGEVAALVVIEAVIRLLPGFMGNPVSLVEESHEAGLLEYPVYTKPSSWRGLDVPPVLLGGDHGAIERWRHEQSVRRTVARRPDLARPADLVTGLAGLDVRPAARADAGELLTLQRACWLQEQQDNPEVRIPALHETLDEVVAWLGEWTVFAARSTEGRLIGAVRCRPTGDRWEIGRIMVTPDLQGRGLGRALLELAEGAAPAEATSYRLLTGAGSTRNLRMYRKAGYRAARSPEPGTVLLTKPVRR